jgi:hypothetical protein
MAGEWIPVRVDLLDVRKLSRFCPNFVQNVSEQSPMRWSGKRPRLSGVSPYVVAFDRHTDDGELIGYATFATR